MDDVKTSISVNNGPEIPINLDDPDAPENAAAKEALAGALSRGGTVQEARDRLRIFVERIERLVEEKRGLAEDISDIYQEAKSQGYDAKAMREVIKLRRMETHARQELEAHLDTYRAALGLA
jgi:uncharacterized protein (UPF0335 family)